MGASRICHCFTVKYYAPSLKASGARRSMGYHSYKILPKLIRKTAVSAMPASALTDRRSTRSLSSYAARDASRFTARKLTGAHNDRRELLKMLDALAPGDVVTVTRIDRLARSTFDLFADRGRQGAV